MNFYNMALHNKTATNQCIFQTFDNRFKNRSICGCSQNLRSIIFNYRRSMSKVNFKIAFNSFDGWVKVAIF